MPHILPKLPYELDALEPYISKETLQYHYEKHHNTYVNNLNKIIANTIYQHKSLIEIIQSTTDATYNNAAQIWNHTFYWDCLSPKKTKPHGKILEAIQNSFGSLDKFKELFNTSALSLFGSGWIWLIHNDITSKLNIINTSNARVPIDKNQKILLTCDMWEHAYYIDYRNDKKKYLESFWHLVNWDFVNDIF